MNVAISIPDDVFVEAEALAKRLKSSRSQIFRGAGLSHELPEMRGQLPRAADLDE